MASSSPMKAKGRAVIAQSDMSAAGHMVNLDHLGKSWRKQIRPLRFSNRPWLARHLGSSSPVALELGPFCYPQ